MITSTHRPRSSVDSSRLRSLELLPLMRILKARRLCRACTTRLQLLDAPPAASVERLVLVALELVDQRKKSTASVWPNGFWSQIRDDFGTEGIERPPQGEFEKRETW